LHEFLNVSPEIREQFVRISEDVGFFFIPNVPVIAFARLVVLSQLADPIDHQRQAILKAVGRAACRSWQTPDNDLDE
jgi:hypothetical protein